MMKIILNGNSNHPALYLLGTIFSSLILVQLALAGGNLQTGARIGIWRLSLGEMEHREHFQKLAEP